jgi:predicted DNA-binding transcriptional regulator AlpA
MSASLPTKRRLLRTVPAAEYCGSTKSTLDKRRVRGEPPAFMKLGKTVVYDSRDLDDWLASCRRESTSEPPTPTPSSLRRGSTAGRLPVPARRHSSDDEL